MASYVWAVGTKVKTRKKMEVFAVGVGRVHIPKGSKGTIVRVDRDANACYVVRMAGLNGDVDFRPHQLDKALW